MHRQRRERNSWQQGINFWNAVGKELFRVLMNWLLWSSGSTVIPESTIDFSLVGELFTWYLLPGKCKRNILSNGPHFILFFVDLTKAFYTVNRDIFWNKRGNIWYPLIFVNMHKLLYRRMKARVVLVGWFLNEIRIGNGIKQGDVLASILFAIVIFMMLNHAF